MPLPSIKDLLSGGIKGIADSFGDIVTKFKADPTKVVEMQSALEQAKIAATLKAEELSNQAEENYAKELETVNQTMREEAKSEHWMVWAWRPTLGFTLAAVIVNNYIICPLMHTPPIVMPGEVWNTLLVILGAASVGRGFTNWQKEKNKS